MSLSSTVSHPRFDFWISFIFLALNAVAFVAATPSPYLRSDVWRHMEEIIIPFLNGTANLSILWSDHQPMPLLHLIKLPT